MYSKNCIVLYACVRILSLTGLLLTCNPAFADDDIVGDTEPVEVVVLESEDDKKVVEYESFMNEMGWDESSQEHRQQIFKKISELKEALRQNIQELNENLQNVKDNEQSLANRTLTAANIAATGIGGMELAMGLAQQKADKAADADMDAYISTFQCKVADNRYKGGESGIELTGANQLTKLYQEYADLAASLKERKAALGMKPGLESQVVLDKANMGLYNDVGHGIEKGAQASRYRASKGSETDAKKLQEEKDAAKKRVIAGGVVAGAGVVGGIVGNLAINGGKNVNKSKEILAKRDDIKRELLEVLQYELNECNAKIMAAKEWATEQKSTSEYKQNEGLRERVSEIEKMKFLTGQKDLQTLKDHPICD